MSTKGIIGGVIIAAVIVIAIFWGYSHHKAEKKADKAGMKNIHVCKNEDNDWVKIPVGFYRDNEGACVEGPPPAPPAPIASSGGKHKTLYVFLPEGCLAEPKYLSGDWERYPKGGKIKFLDSQGKVVLIDEPGTYVPSSLPAGEYKICKVDPNAWGVEIWE